MDADVQRNLTLVVPLLAVCLLAAWRNRDGTLRARLPGAVLATLLAWPGILAVEGMSAWWEFVPGPTDVLGVPVETSAGWALAWGALPVLAGGRPWWWWVGFAWVDVLVVPRLEPLVVLGDGWLLGEAVLLVGVAAPALALGHLTRVRRVLPVRVVLQAVTFMALVGWAVPTIAFRHDGLGWGDVVDHGLVGRTALLAALVVVGVPVLSAVVELARAGGGTPFPWDPTERLVATGPYAYLRNPMQVGACLLLGLLGFAAGSVTLLVGTALAAIFSLVVADPQEREALAERWPGEGGYVGYRAAVRAWVPRWRPVVREPSTLWVAESCEVCRSTGDALTALGPTGLEVRAAELSRVRLTRMRWTGAHVEDRGVAAVARALEQVSLPWAWVGWLVRLPLVTPVLQLVADACGLGPRDLPAPVRTVAP